MYFAKALKDLWAGGRRLVFVFPQEGSATRLRRRVAKWELRNPKSRASLRTMLLHALCPPAILQKCARQLFREAWAGLGGLGHWSRTRSKSAESWRYIGTLPSLTTGRMPFRGSKGPRRTALRFSGWGKWWPRGDGQSTRQVRSGRPTGLRKAQMRRLARRFPSFPKNPACFC